MNVKQSFENVKKWKDEFLTNARVTNADTFPFVVVGNKIDYKSDMSGGRK